MRAAMRAASPYLLAMLSPVRIVSDYRWGAISGRKRGVLRCDRRLSMRNNARRIAFGCSLSAQDFEDLADALVGLEVPGLSCQSLMPPSIALVFAPRITWLGRDFISLALPPPRRTVSQTIAALRRLIMSRTDFLQRLTPRRS